MRTEVCGCVFQRERDELPLEIRVGVVVLEHAAAGSVLDSLPACRADSQLARFGGQVISIVVYVVLNPADIPAASESFMRAVVVADLTEVSEPELPFLLASFEPHALLRAIVMNRWFREGAWREM